MAQSPEPKRQKIDLERKGSVYSVLGGMPRHEGRMHHLGIADGELANRVAIVGPPSRADMMAEFLQPEEPGQPLFRLASDRGGFVVYTGFFEGERVSVVAIGMGLAMVDFFLREGRSTMQGPMAVVRLGTCGILQREVDPGTVSVAANGSVLVQRNYAAFNDDGEVADNGHTNGQTNGDAKGYTNGAAKPPFTIVGPCPPDPELSEVVVAALREELGEDVVLPCMNASADSFYSTQGRIDPNFNDGCSTLFEELLSKHPDVLSMEMETFMLLHLARCCRPKGSIRAAAAHINVANRASGAILDADKLRELERNSGRAILRALARMKL